MNRIWEKFWLPGSILIFGGFIAWSSADFQDDVQRTENHLRRLKTGVLSDSEPIRWQYRPRAAEAQARAVQFQKENMYPYGNPPYKDILRIASRRNHKPVRKAEKLINRPAELEAELEALENDQDADLQLPSSLKRDPEKRKEALKMYTDTYKVFERQIQIATEVVKDAAATGSRTEKEINEALEAIEQMKRGRRMVIDRIRVIEKASEEETEVGEEPESFEDTLYGE